MRAERRALAGGDVWHFTCRTNRGKTTWACDEPAAIKDDGRLERWVVDRFLEAVPRLRVEARACSPRLGELEQAAIAAQDSFEQWRDDDRVQQRLGMDTYLAGLEARRDKRDAAAAAFARERAAVGTVAVPANADDIAAHWPTLTAGEQRALLQSAIRCVFVRGSRRTAPFAGRLHVVWQGEDVALPRGVNGWIPEPFVFGDN